MAEVFFRCNNCCHCTVTHHITRYRASIAIIAIPYISYTVYIISYGGKYSSVIARYYFAQNFLRFIFACHHAGGDHRSQNPQRVLWCGGWVLKLPPGGGVLNQYINW